MTGRRDLLLSLGRLGVLGALLPGNRWTDLLAQATREDTWGKDKLISRSLRPPDYETPVALLDSYLTPNEHFYVRSHMAAPSSLDAATWTLAVEGEVTTPLTLSLDEIRRMPSATVTMTLECAGNGRAFFDPPVAGIQWQKGAVGTARWTGVRLADLLKRAGVKQTGAFVLMNGADRGPGTMPDFIRQVPLSKAMHQDTLVAYEMNGVPIPPVHGFPLRAIVPGWEGAYAIKWLTNLRIVDREFDGFWVATGYRYPTKRVKPGAAVAPADMAPLTGLVIKSLITRPLDYTTVAPGKIAVAGFAWAGEDDVQRVDVSADHGATWQPAALVGERTPYAWRRFETTIDATKPESYLIMSRATDSKGRTQPEVAAWNPSGYLWNAPDRVRIEVSTTETQAAQPVPAPMPAHDTAQDAQGLSAGDAVFQRSCLSCHGRDLVEQQRLSQGGWTREVDKMMRWGAQVPEPDKDALVRFLTARYGPFRP